VSGATEAAAERAIVTLKKAIEAAENSNQAGEDFVVAAAAAPVLLEALHEGRRAIGDHFAPNDCYATGPLTGDAFRDLVQCPACSFIAIYEAAIAKATGSQVQP
jgi:hypothetical protein